MRYTENEIKIIMDLKDKELSKLSDEVSRLKMEQSKSKTDPRHEFSGMLLEMFGLAPDRFDLNNPRRIALFIRRSLDMAEAGKECYRDIVREMIKERE